MYFTQIPKTRVQWASRDHFYFGQPSAGFFLSSDFLTASSQSQSILSNSGLGPGCVGGFFGTFFCFFIRLRIIWYWVGLYFVEISDRPKISLAYHFIDESEPIGINGSQLIFPLLKSMAESNEERPYRL